MDKLDSRLWIRIVTAALICERTRRRIEYRTYDPRVCNECIQGERTEADKDVCQLVDSDSVVRRSRGACLPGIGTLGPHREDANDAFDQRSNFDDKFSDPGNGRLDDPVAGHLRITMGTR